jgi:hypothetical protein
VPLLDQYGFPLRPVKGNRTRGPSPTVQLRNEQIRADRQAGMSASNLAKKYSVSKITVYKVIRDLPRPPRPPRPPSPRSQRCLAAYNNGANASEIAKAEGISCERVCQYLRPHRVIELRVERRRIARDTLEIEAAVIRHTARVERAAKLAMAVDLVRNGTSYCQSSA